MSSSPCTRVVLWAAFVASVVASPSAAQYQQVTALKVVNGSNVDRVGEAVSVSVPGSQGLPFYNMFGVRVADPSGNLIPAQFKVLTRWGGARDDVTKPIRWVSATFKATVAANSTADYQLLIAPGTSVPGGLWAAQDMNTIQIHTGPNTYFTLDRLALTVFKEAVIDGVSVLSGPGWSEFVYADGSSPAPWVYATDLEEYLGYLSTRCIVKQKGYIGPLAFTIRWTFIAGRNDVTVDFRLENPAAYGLFSTSIPDGQKYFDRCYLHVPVAGTTFTATTTTAAHALGTAALYKLEQHFAWTANQLDVLAGFNYTETLDGAPIGSGGRYEGALDVSSASKGLTVTVDRFWQNFPKALHAQGGDLKVGLWPEFGGGPYFQGQYALPGAATPPIDPGALNDYRFEGSRWKTHRMVFDFHASGPRAPAAVLTESERAGAPLAGRVPGDFIRHSNAMNTLWTERKTWSNALFNRYERFYDICVDDNAADNLLSIGKIGYPAFINRGGTNGGLQNYGWDNFGDLTWADGYCDLHYDLTESFLTGFLRTGDYRFFSNGRNMAAYRRDYGQNHSTNVAETWRGAQFYEKGWWHGNYVMGQYSHNWIGGLLLHYVITGEEASREAAIENINFVLRDPPKNWTGYWGSRIIGWQINCLMDAYAFLGDPAYLTEAGLGVARFKTLELAQGGNGYVLNLGSNPQTTKPWMDNIFFIAACKYVVTSQDYSSADLLDRMRGFFKNTCLTLPSGPPTAMVPAQVYYEWGPTFTGVKSVHLLWPMCESFAWSALVFFDLEDQNYAQMCFETVCRYWQTGPSSTPINFYDANTWSKITFKPGYYPGTESKAMSNLLRWAPGYLTIQRLVDGDW